MVLNPLRAFLKSALHSITGYGSDFKKAPQHNENLSVSVAELSQAVRQLKTTIALLNLLQKSRPTHAEQFRCFAVLPENSFNTSSMSDLSNSATTSS